MSAILKTGRLRTGALPGEEVVVEATKVHPKFSEGRIKKSVKIRASGKATMSNLRFMWRLPAAAFGLSSAIKEKRDIVVQAFERYSKTPIEKLNIKETIGMENPWNYRNKSQFQVGLKRQR